MWEKMKPWFPPGYEYEREISLFFVALGCGFLVSLSFLVRLDGQVEALYYYHTNAEKMLQPGAVAESFLGLAGGTLWGCGMVFLYLAAAAFDHWLYYRRTGGCLYLMKRLPQKGVLAGSCLRGPLAGTAVLAAGILFVYAVYYVCYRLRIPQACLPRFW